MTPCLKGDTIFKKPSFLVSMLVVGDVDEFVFIPPKKSQDMDTIISEAAELEQQGYVRLGKAHDKYRHPGK